MATPEACDIGGWFFSGETKTGYLNHNPGFDKDPKTNTNLLLGCTETCQVETGTWRCPLAADIHEYAGTGKSWSLNACTDRCGDTLYDGPFSETGIPNLASGRHTSYTTKRKSAWHGLVALGQAGIGSYPTAYTEYITGQDYSGRMLTEQCDTLEVAAGDYTHGCDRLCQVSTEKLSNNVDPAWICNHYHLDVTHLEHPIFRTHCEWQGPGRRRMRALAEDYDA